jgi:hypothetical protein
MQWTCDDASEKPEQFGQHLQGLLRMLVDDVCRFPDFTTFSTLVGAWDAWAATAVRLTWVGIGI